MLAAHAKAIMEDRKYIACQKAIKALEPLIEAAALSNKTSILINTNDFAPNHIFNVCLEHVEYLEELLIQDGYKTDLDIRGHYITFDLNGTSNVYRVAYILDIDWS
ncbi:hypothetical protein phiOC_p131 [Ochrobactrum phage vB_OspM_OC]|nr:hypothetical protein phiOC_p131 [Ochrobactrum phage vB_OspM_OC]